jgi:adenylate cyclase
MSIRAGRAYVLLVLIILAGAVAFRIADPFVTQALRLIAFDSYQRLAPATYDPSLPVRVVDIDEESLARIGQWPWPRTIMAELIEKLNAQGAAASVFDILFAEADQNSPEQAIKHLPADEAAAISKIIGAQEPFDSVFARAIAATPTVLAVAFTSRISEPPPQKAGFAVAGDDPRRFIPTYGGAARNLRELDEKATGIGSINWTPDRDQVIRRVPLLYRVGDNFYPTLVTESLRVAQGANTYVLKASNASGETAFGAQTGLNNIKIGNIQIPTDADGGIWIQFRKSHPEAYLPAWKVLAGEIDPAEIAGRIMLIGTSAPGLIDLRASPLDPTIAGVEVHAQAIEHILSGRTLTRPDYSLALELAVIVLGGILLAILLPRMSASSSALLGLAVIALLLVGGWAAYRYAGMLLDPTYPALALTVLVGSATTYVYRRVEMQRGEVRRAFSHYVSPDVVNEIISNPGRLELGGEVRELTLLFCDVRNFTSISERMTAHELTSFINGLLTPLSEVILDHRGTIDKYMGDAIMAFWNAPLDDPDHAGHACAAALKMVERMADLNVVWQKEAEAAGKPFSKVGIGIGINSGNCCVGNLGSKLRFDYSAIGDDVNLASRIEGQSKYYGVPIVVGETTVARNPGLAVLELDLMRVKGRSQPTHIYVPKAALGIGEGIVESLSLAHQKMLVCYRAQDWDGAEKALAAARAHELAGLDHFYKLYAHRIETWRKSPPPHDWDGTFSATEK